jgi:hypothetical protein
VGQASDDACPASGPIADSGTGLIFEGRLETLALTSTGLLAIV